MRLLLVYTLLGYILTSQVAAETTWAKMLEDFNPEEEIDRSSKEYKLMEYKVAQCETKVLKFEYEKSKIEEKCEDHLQNLTQENASKLQATIQQHEEQISTLEKEHQEEVLNKDNSMKESLWIKLQNYQDEIKELKLQLANITEINNENLKMLSTKQEALDKMKALHIEEMGKNEEKHQEEIRSLKLQHEKNNVIDNPDLCIDATLKENVKDSLKKFNFIDNTVNELEQSIIYSEEKEKKVIENQKAEMDSLHLQHSEVLENLKKNQDEVENSTTQSLQDEITEKEKLYEQELEELKLELEVLIKSMEKSSSRLEAKLRKKYGDEAEKLKQSHEEELAKIKKDYEDQIQKLKEQHKNEILQLTEKHNDEIINLQTKHDSEISTLKREKQERMTEISRLQLIKQELETNLAIHIKKHETEKEIERKEFETKLTLIKLQYSADVESLKQNLSMELVNRTESYNDEIRDCKENAYNKLLTEQEQQYWLIKNGTHELAVENRRIQTSCEDTIKQMRHESQVERSEHLRVKQLMQEKHDIELTERKEEIKSLKQEYSARINSIETKHTYELVEKKNEINELKQEHSKQIKSSETKHKSELDEKKKEIYDLKNEHSARVSSLEKEVKERDEKNKRLETVSTSCKNDFTTLQNTQRTEKDYFCKGKYASNLVTLGAGRYQFNTDNSNNWYVAQKNCRQQGLHLLVIETSDEHNRIVHYLRNILGATEEYWIGGSGVGSKKAFYWTTTGNRLDEYGSLWLKNEPNDNNRCGQNCIELFYEDEKYGWCDMSCHSERYFICELDSKCL